MPLRDHFRPPLAARRRWDGFHGSWPTLIVQGLNRILPEDYVAEAQVHLGSSIEIEVATHEEERPLSSGGERVEDHGAETALWTPPEPTLAVATDLSDLDEYEVRVYEDTESIRRLVAAVEIVSPSNKDRPASRRAFVAKCSALLQNHVCIAIVDIVTARTSNLYQDLLDFLGESAASVLEAPPPLYAVSCRWTRKPKAEFLETWAHPLSLGQPLPTLPLWISENRAVPLDLEQSYEETCRVLRIP
jgi:hypothetical protein